MRGRSTCAARPTPSTGPTPCRWPRASSSTCKRHRGRRPRAAGRIPAGTRRPRGPSACRPAGDGGAMTDGLAPTTRFTDRVADYVRHRPGYPPALLRWLRDEHGVAPDWPVADIGAGTGISARMFLEAGHAVVAVEPIPAMRQAAIAALGGHPRFAAVDGRAEATHLPDASVALVSAAQAFHWFDRRTVKAESRRILRPGGLVAVYWNFRRTSGSPFLEGYERLLREHAPEYAQVAGRYPDEAAMARWFGAGLRGMATFPNTQRLDLDA